MTTDWQVRARRALPWIVGPLALMLRARAVELSPPNPCPGLLELVSIAMLRLQPDMRVGHVYQALEALAIVVGIGAFIELISRTTRRPWVAAAVGLATALGPAFPRTIAPPWEAAAFAACAIAAVLLSARVSSVRTTTRGLCASLLFVALLVPSWAVVAAAVVALCVTTAGRPDQPATRVALAIMASGAVLALTAGLLMLTPPQVFTQPFSWRAVTACIVSPQEVPWHRAFWTGPASAPGRIAWQLGPFGLGLAALGAFVLATRGVQARRLASTLLGLAALCIALLVASLSPATSQASALMPIVIASWWLAPVGLQEMLGSIGPQPMASLATVVILIVLPALQGARVRAEERDDGMRSRGHEAATLRQIVAVLNFVTPNAGFVEEDSTIDVLLRAAVFGGRRAGKSFTVLPPERHAVGEGLATRSVYAFPVRQADLAQQGFSLEPLRALHRPGGEAVESVDALAIVTGMRACRVIGNEWVSLDGIAERGRIALSGDSETAYGPVALFLGGSAAADPKPDNWPLRATRGFALNAFDQRVARQSEALRGNARDLGLSLESPVLAAPFVIELVLHRTPRAPRALSIDLGGGFPLGAARLQYPGPQAGHLTICDAPVVQGAMFGGVTTFR